MEKISPPLRKSWVRPSPPLLSLPHHVEYGSQREADGQQAGGTRAQCDQRGAVHRHEADVDHVQPAQRVGVEVQGGCCFTRPLRHLITQRGGGGYSLADPVGNAAMPPKAQEGGHHVF